MFKRIFLCFMSFLFVFSTVSSSIGVASAGAVEQEVIDLAELEQLSNQEVTWLSKNIKMVEKSNDHMSKITASIESENLQVESEINTDLHTGKIEYIGEIQEGNETTVFDFQVFLNYVDGEDFGGFLVDNSTGQEYSFDTKMADASAAPLVIVAIHIVRYGVQWAIKKHGKKVVQNALKSASHKAAKDIKKSLLNDNGVKIQLFTKRVKGKQDLVDPKSGWSISRDVGKGNSHGGSYWKLTNKSGTRIATLDKSGKVLRR